MKDFLIVGFGLAGLSASRHAELKHKTFDIISDQSQLSSRIAGGILNPVVVKRMKPVWLVEEFLPYAIDYYKKLDSVYQCNSFQDNIIQVFVHNNEQENNWYFAREKIRLKPYLSSEVKKNNNASLNIDKLGEVKAAMVNLNILLNSAREYYTNHNNSISETFEYSDLAIYNDNVSYKKQDYKHVIFCEGYGVHKNPFFNNLGIYGNKGDYLILRIKNFHLRKIIKAMYFLIPLGNDLYKFGATYQREPLNHEPSEIAKSQMLEALNKMLNIPYEVVNQICGIRPTTRDRRPVVGTHASQKRLHILNGFGSRGVMLSPKLGQQLIANIIEDQPLNPEISIRRFDVQT